MKRIKMSTPVLLPIFLVLNFYTGIYSSAPNYPIISEPKTNHRNLNLQIKEELPNLELPAQKDIIELSANFKPPARQSNFSSTTLTGTNKASSNNPQSNCTNYYGYIQIGGKTICLSSTDSTSGSLSYAHAYIFNSPKQRSYNQFIFGHNSNNLFASLGGLPVGTNFTVTLNGVSTQYRISSREIVCDPSNPSHPCSNYSEPVLDMRDPIRPERRQAALSIMTCAGTSIGGGDATHRLVVYAQKV